MTDAPTLDLSPDQREPSPNPREPITEAAAWQWLEREASTKGGRIVASVRSLAEAWNWHRSRVERFLSRLRAETRIETATQGGKTAITICANREKRMPTDSKTAETVERLPATAAPKPNLDDKFWDEAKEDGVIIQERADRVAVYRTARDQIGIRSEAMWPDDDSDPWIIIDPKNLDALISRLTQIRDELSRE